MTEKGKNFSVYLNKELLDKLERIKEQTGYGNSQAVANLIDVRDNEIKDGVTRRQVMSEIREFLAVYRQELAHIRDRQDYFIDEWLRVFDERLSAIEAQLRKEEPDVR
jgi:hypothetical protein